MDFRDRTKRDAGKAGRGAAFAPMWCLRALRRGRQAGRILNQQLPPAAVLADRMACAWEVTEGEVTEEG
jgi:hypothetical protein